MLFLSTFFFLILISSISTDIIKFNVKLSLSAQRIENGWVVTYHVVKMPCGILDLYYLLSQMGWRGGEFVVSICNKEVNVRVVQRQSGNVVEYDVETDVSFDGAHIDTRVKVTDSL